MVILELTSPFTREKEAPSSSAADGQHDELAPWDLPWALELGTGGGMVLGETDRGQPVWVVNYIAEGGYMTTLTEVVAAWS